MLAHRTKDSGNELVLTAAHYKTENLPLNQRHWQQQEQQIWQQQWQRTQIALIATNFCSYSHPLEPLLDLLACGQVSSGTWRGDCRADLQRESTIVRQVKHPQLEICPALESAPPNSVGNMTSCDLSCASFRLRLGRFCESESESESESGCSLCFILDFCSRTGSNANLRTAARAEQLNEMKRNEKETRNMAKL